MVPRPDRASRINNMLSSLGVIAEALGVVLPPPMELPTWRSAFAVDTPLNCNSMIAPEVAPDQFPLTRLEFELIFSA